VHELYFNEFLCVFGRFLYVYREVRSIKQWKSAENKVLALFDLTFEGVGVRLVIQMGMSASLCLLRSVLKITAMNLNFKFYQAKITAIWFLNESHPTLQNAESR
jgi:hypothetical protein